MFLSKTLPALMTRKEDLYVDCTRFPELVERTDGAKLLPSPETVAVLTGRRATSLMSDVLSAAPVSVHSTNASVHWRFTSQTLLIRPSPKMKDRRTEIMMTIPLISDDWSKYNYYFHSAICSHERFRSRSEFLWNRWTAIL